MNKQPSTAGEPGIQQTGVVDLNERNWLPRHCRGDQQAFGQLLRAYRRLVYTFLCRYGIEPQNRDDLFQDIFLRVHQAASGYRPSESLRPWLISIVLNTVRNFRRDRGRRKHFMNQLRQTSASGSADDGAGTAGLARPYQAGLDEQAEQQATVSWLQQQITTLPERQREVLVLSTLQGLRMKEIASILRLPENTVKTHLRRARLALAEGLAERENRTAAVGHHL